MSIREKKYKKSHPVIKGILFNFTLDIWTTKIKFFFDRFTIFRLNMIQNYLFRGQHDKKDLKVDFTHKLKSGILIILFKFTGRRRIIDRWEGLLFFTIFVIYILYILI